MKDSVYADMTDAEKQVAEYLRELNLWWVYEFPVFVYDDKDRPRVWAPDFFIPKLGMYVEVCGKERRDYRYRRQIFKKNGYHVIFLRLYREEKEWKNHLVKMILELEEKRHDEVMNMIRMRVSTEETGRKYQKAYTLEEVRKTHPRAYMKWTRDEDQALAKQFKEGIPIPELGKLHSRKPGAIRSRLAKLGLLKPEND